MVAGVGFEPHDLRVMRASNGFGFKIHRLAKTYTRKAEPTKKPTNVGGEGRGDFVSVLRRVVCTYPLGGHRSFP